MTAMRIGVGLPSNVVDVECADIVSWAQRAEALGFSSLTVTDRLAWNQHEPLITLAAAAAVTGRITLRTSVIVIPNRGSAGLLAKQLATLDRLSGGRLVVGVGVGDRDNDYRLAGQERDGRYRRLDEMLEQMTAIWAGTDAELAVVGPRPQAGRIPLLIGGGGERTFQRAARHGAGWAMAVGTADDFREGVTGVRAAWAAHGRDGAPTVAAQRYFGLGEGAAATAQAYLRTYFAFLGPFAERVALSAPTDEEAVCEAVRAFEAAGADELVFIPTTTDIRQLELLATTVFPAGVSRW